MLILNVRHTYCIFRSINAVSSIWLHICTALRNGAFVGAVRQYHNRLVEQYHSTVPDEAHQHILTDFTKQSSSIRVLIATVGFGLEVDIPDIKRIIHWGASDGILQYWQEIGWAGRDGASSPFWQKL